VFLPLTEGRVKSTTLREIRFEGLFQIRAQTRGKGKPKDKQPCPEQQKSQRRPPLPASLDPFCHFL